MSTSAAQSAAWRTLLLADRLTAPDSLPAGTDAADVAPFAAPLVAPAALTGVLLGPAGLLALARFGSDGLGTLLRKEQHSTATF